jgi:hypothetical protein
MLDAASRLADTGLEVAGFSMICRWLVIMAGKGLREETLKVESLKLKWEEEEKTEGAKGLATPTPGVSREP